MLSSTSARPLMPMPPTPMKWMRRVMPYMGATRFLLRSAAPAIHLLSTPATHAGRVARFRRRVPSLDPPSVGAPRPSAESGHPTCRHARGFAALGAGVVPPKAGVVLLHTPPTDAAHRDSRVALLDLGFLGASPGAAFGPRYQGAREARGGVGAREQARVRGHARQDLAVGQQVRDLLGE